MKIGFARFHAFARLLADSRAAWQKPTPFRLILTFLILIAGIQTACNLPSTGEEAETDEATPSMPISITPLPDNLSKSGWWQPTPGLSWQWQLGDEPIDTSISAGVYDVDLYADQAQINLLRERGAMLIGYISVGSWEEWRPDADQFPPELLGNDYAGWPGEKWLDIRRIDLLGPILQARFDLCKAKGFAAIEPDNMDIYTNDTGFPLTDQDQLNFARWLAAEAHTRGLAIGIKNAPEQVNDLVNLYDFAVTEDCFAQGWCEAMLPIIQAGKPVFAAEYTDTGVDFQAACAWGKKQGFSFILKDRDLNAWIETCP